MPSKSNQNLYDILGIEPRSDDVEIKVRIFWDGHKNLKNLPPCFDDTNTVAAHLRAAIGLRAAFGKFLLHQNPSLCSVTFGE